MKAFLFILFVLPQFLSIGVLEAQEVETEQPYSIRKKVEEVSQGCTKISEIYHCPTGGLGLVRTSTITNMGKELHRGVKFYPLIISERLATNANEDDKTRLLFDRGISAFGWYGENDKSMFDTIYVAAAVAALSLPGGDVLETKNLLVHNKAGDYGLLDQAGLDMVKAKGIIATIEDRIGQQLAKKKGILVSQKHFNRGLEGHGEPLLRCHEAVVKLGPNEQEKLYTFFGNQLGVNYKIFEWTVNNKSKFSWIDCETGLGTFMFQDSDGDGVFETLELVVDNNRNVEIFDVSDPWNINLVPLDSDLFEDANASKNRAEGLGKRLKELIDQGALEHSDGGILQESDQ